MTVKEFIEELKKYPENYPIYVIRYYNGEKYYEESEGSWLLENSLDTDEPVVVIS